MNIGPEMLFLLLLAFLLFGPKKLPEIGRKLGKGLAEFKRASNELKGQLETELRQLEAEDREKKIAPPAPPPPENTVAVAAAPSAPTVPDPQLSLPMADPPQAVALAAPPENPPSPAPGVEGA